MTKKAFDKIAEGLSEALTVARREGEPSRIRSPAIEMRAFRHGAHGTLSFAHLRTDVRDVRDQLARVEERVSHLPGKGFIVSVVTTALGIGAALVALAPKLQALFP